MLDNITLLLLIFIGLNLQYLQLTYGGILHRLDGDGRITGERKV